MRKLGNKVAARNLAIEVGVPVVPATEPLPDDIDAVKKMAAEIGYPVMLKASWGGGGRGMRVIRAEADLAREVTEAKREAKAAFGKDEVYLEKLVERARHVEVQVLGDKHGNAVHLFERDCSIQRRNQKVVERAPAPYLDAMPARRTVRLRAEDRARHRLCRRRHGRVPDGCRYRQVLLHRGQSAHPGRAHRHRSRSPASTSSRRRSTSSRARRSARRPRACRRRRTSGSTATRCSAASRPRIRSRTSFPDYGRITAYRGATGFGIRLDGGTAYSGAVITRYYDPLLEKVTAWAPTAREAIARMDRALREFRIRGVATNLTFLEAIITHPNFHDNSYTTRFIDTTPELFQQVKRQDRATKLLTYLADVTVNGHPETRGRPTAEAGCGAAGVPYLNGDDAVDGTKQLLDQLGPKKFAEWMREQKQVLVTDTTMRDGHQSLLATRMRTYDIARIAGTYARALPQLFSLECWGGATFDVAMRFLTEDPWERLALIREDAPNLLLQMLLRGANGVGYTNYPDNVVQLLRRRRRRRAASTSSACSTASTGSTTCASRWTRCARRTSSAKRRSATPATSSIRRAPKYDLKYYVALAKELEAGRRAYHRRQGHGRPAEAGRGARAVQGAARGDRPADPFPHARHVGHVGGDGACRRR